MTELEFLYDQKTKAEGLANSSKGLTVKQIKSYNTICYRILSLEKLKILQLTAPESMDPKKVEEHWNEAFSIIKEIEPNPNEELKNLYQKGLEKFSKRPTTVQDYSNNLKNFIKTFIVLWKKQHNFKTKTNKEEK